MCAANNYRCSSVAVSVLLLTKRSRVRSPSPVLRRGIQLKEQKQNKYGSTNLSAFVVRIFVRLAQPWLEHQSYELRVGSSNLPMDIWSSSWSIWRVIQLSRLEPTTNPFDCLRETIRRMGQHTRQPRRLPIGFMMLPITIIDTSYKRYWSIG